MVEGKCRLNTSTKEGKDDSSTVGTKMRPVSSQVPKAKWGNAIPPSKTLLQKICSRTELLKYPIDEDSEFDFPERIFNVYRGVPYVAVQTQPGVSYHGYPWCGRMSGSVRKEEYSS